LWRVKLGHKLDFNVAASFFLRVPKMLLRLPWALALVFAFVLPLGAADEKKDKENGDKPEKSESSLKDAKPTPPKKHDHVLVGALGGTLKSVSNDQMILTVKYPDTQANQQTLMKGMQQAMRNAQRAGNTRGYRGGRGRQGQMVQQMIRMQRMMMNLEMGEIRVMQNLAKNFKYKTQDVNLTLSAQMSVRVKEPPPDFDDKGVAKRYTAQELKTLKGDSKAWGYPGEPTQLHAGQYVAVYIYKKKKPVVAKTVSSKDKEEETPEADDDPDGFEPLVRKIYILNEGVAIVQTPGKK
jgi:hypothetical protein